MGYTLGQAEKATGKSKTAIRNAIQKGRLSAGKDAKGQYDIDPAELHRVYPAVSNDTGNVPGLSITPETDVLRAENKLLREMVDDLRGRLDVESEERRRLTLLLTDQRAPQRPAGGFWRWLAGDRTRQG